MDRKLLVLAVIAFFSKLLINLTTDYLLLLDSWVLYHVLDAVTNGYEILPRGLSYFYFPLSYLPFVPFAKVFGSLFTLKFVYPLFTSLSIIPIYGLLSIYSRDWKKNFLISLSFVFIDDFFIRSAGATPHGLALLFFFSSLYFLASKNPKLFLLSSLMTAMTHSLTSLVLGAFLLAHYFAASRKKDGQDYSYALYFLFLGSYWVMANALSGKGPLFLYSLLKLLPALVLLVIFFALSKKSGALEKLASMEEKKLSLGIIAIAITLLIFVLLYSSHSFLSHFGLLSLLLVPSYILLPAILLPSLLRERGLWFFSYVLVVLWFIGSVLLRVNCAFDSFRLLPFTLIPLLFSSAKSKRGHLVFPIILVSLISHLFVVYPSLAYTDNEYNAALWVRENTEQGTIATDTRLSAIFLAIGQRSGTFEGTYWLFARDNIEDFIYTFNKYRYADYPIKYITIPSYAFSSGADISWNIPDFKTSERMVEKYDGLGELVYENPEVRIWELNERKISSGKEIKVRFERDLMDKLLSGLFNAGASEGYDPREVYGTRC